jgi:hypothetical protein
MPQIDTLMSLNTFDQTMGVGVNSSSARISILLLPLLSILSLDNAAVLAATPVAASLNGSSIGPMTQFIDSKSNTWTLKGGVAYENGAKAGTTADIKTLLYYNGSIYQLNTQGGWYEWNGTSWPAISADPRVVSANNSDITSTSSIVDSDHNVWVISAAGVIYKNGVTAGETAKVVNLIYSGGKIYQKNSLGNFYVWNGSSWPASASPLGTGSSGGGIEPPAPAAAVSYTRLAWDSEFTSLDLIDTTNSQEQTNKDNQDFQWYTTCHFCKTSTPADALSIIPTANATSALHIDGAKAPGSGIYSALYTTKEKPYTVVGAQNQTGGPNRGFYFEVNAAMSQPTKGSSTWPTIALFQTFTDVITEWPGSASAAGSANASNKPIPAGDVYNDNLEIDLMELMPSNLTYENKTPQASFSLHDWYGVQNESSVYCPAKDTQQFCQSSAPYFFGKLYDGPNSTLLDGTQYSGASATLTSVSGSNDEVFNTFGVLVVPTIKDSNGAWSQGYIQFFFNGVPFDVKQTYTGLPTGSDLVPVNPTTTPWMWGVADLNKFSFVINSGGGAFMDVRWVRVWEQ